MSVISNVSTFLKNYVKNVWIAASVVTYDLNMSCVYAAKLV